jgi:hypothetical protein
MRTEDVGGYSVGRSSPIGDSQCGFARGAIDYQAMPELIGLANSF